MTTNESVVDADLAAYCEDFADAAAAAGFRACWVLPVHVRPDRQPTAALVLWRFTAGRAVGYLTNSAGRVARVAALALEADRNRVAWARAARTDGLTGLSNRLELDDRLDSIARSDPDRPVAALFCDLDEFKPVNDRLGHDIGDAVLACVAERIRRAVRPSDVVTRWGGDEFVVLCTEATTSDDALAVAQRLVDEINRPIAIAGHDVHLGVSIGVATAKAGDAANLVRDADGGLRDAKSAGKNQCRLAT